MKKGFVVMMVPDAGLFLRAGRMMSGKNESFNEMPTLRIWNSQDDAALLRDELNAGYQAKKLPFAAIVMTVEYEERTI